MWQHVFHHELGDGWAGAMTRFKVIDNRLCPVKFPLTGSSTIKMHDKAAWGQLGPGQEHYLSEWVKKYSKS